MVEGNDGFIEIEPADQFDWLVGLAPTILGVNDDGPSLSPCVSAKGEPFLERSCQIVHRRSL